MKGFFASSWRLLFVWHCVILELFSPLLVANDKGHHSSQTKYFLVQSGIIYQRHQNISGEAVRLSVIAKAKDIIIMLRSSGERSRR